MDVMDYSYSSTQAAIESIDIDKVSSMASLLNDYGPAIVIIAVFIILFMIAMLMIMKNFLSNQIAVQQQNKQLLNTILNRFNDMQSMEEDRIKKEDKKNIEKNIVTRFVKLNSVLKGYCKTYLNKIKCDRIAIFVFHNGSYSSHGLPFFKLSCICESIRRGCGIPLHQNDSSSVPLTVYDDIIEVLHSYTFAIVRNNIDAFYLSPNTNDSSDTMNNSTISVDLDDDPSTPANDINISNCIVRNTASFHLIQDKAKTAIFVAVYDTSDNIVACILAEFLDSISDAAIDSNLTLLKEFGMYIAPIVEYDNTEINEEDKDE